MKSLILRGYRPALVVLGLLLTAVAQAAVPSALTADGVLTSQGGGPVADGNYAVTFVIYKDAAGGAPVWSEGPLQVAVKNGAFSQVLGAVKPVDAGVAAAGGWITLAVGNDPELARKPWRSVPFALRAQVAEGLECSGCIKAAMLDPQTVPAVAKSGAYSDLSGLPTLAKLGTTCGSGLVVKGLKADGSLECVAGLVGGKCAAGQVVTEVKADGSVTCGVVGITGGACEAGQVVTEVKADGTVVCGGVTATLPPDGLSAVSNGLLTNVFDEVYASTTTPKNIPDNNPGGILDEIIVPDTGTVKDITISVAIASQDTTGLVVTVFDPLNNAYVLHNKTDAGTALKTAYPVPTKLVSGDLSTWLGKNPKGTWRLVATDWKAGGSVGVLNGWAVNLKVLSTTKVGATAGLVAANLSSPCLNGYLANPTLKCFAGTSTMTGPSGAVNWTASCPAGSSAVFAYYIQGQLSTTLFIASISPTGTASAYGYIQGGEIRCCKTDYLKCP